VAKRLRRRFIGIERDPGYAELARARLAKVRPVADPDLVATPSKRQAPRVPFGWLIERGLLEPGTILYGPGKRWSAKVRADGRLVAADCTGSIHQVGAQLQGAPACNGWQFWNLDVEGRLVSIDVLRQKVRAELN
jgi:modification methylase